MRDFYLLGAKRTVRRIGLYTAILALCFVVLLPIVWTIIVSVKPPAELFSRPFSIAFTPTLQNYRTVLYGSPFKSFFLNSLIVSTLTAFLSLLIATPGAYASVRFGVGGQFFKQWVLSIWFLPPIVAAIPIYLIEIKLKLLDTYIGLVIPYLLLNIPFAFLLVSSFIAGVPEEIEEAALVDGCSRFTAFYRIVFPLSLPGFLVTFAFCFMFAWNEYLFALLITATKVKTLPVHITSYMSIHSIWWGEVAAAGMIMIAPMLIILVVIQKYLVKGLTLGALD